MKIVKLRDAVRHLSEKASTWPVRVERFSYENIPGIGTGEVKLSSPLTIITGQNSIGKTTFLRSIWMGLDGARANSSELTRRKVRGGKIEIDVFRFGNEYERRVEILPEVEYEQNTDFDVFHLDSAEAIVDLQQKIFLLGETVDIINGAPERDLEAKELQEVSYLTRRAYEKVKVFEIEIEVGLIAPFFEVLYNGASYDATQMGSGEYAALFAWWTLKGAPNGSVVLIEEPETFLSSLNQESLLQYLVAIIDQKKLCAIITTHSGHLLHGLPSNSIHFLRRSGQNCEFVTNPHPTSLAAVGIYLKPDVFVYVEDKAARIVGRLLIERFDPTFARRCHLEPVGGEAVITKALEASASNPFGLRFVGWYDGDQEGKIPEKVRPLSALLPGSEPIEILFRKFVTAGQDAAEIAFGNKRVSEVLANLEGQDPHDWTYRFSEALGRDHESILSTMFDLWISEPANMLIAEQRFLEFKEVAGDTT